MAASEDMETDEFNLLNFPDEVLVKIFSNFDCMDLMNASHVCTRFEKIAVDAFAVAYNGDTKEKYFKVTVTYPSVHFDEQTMYRPFFGKFGKGIVALNLRLVGYGPVDPEHWLFEMIKENCTSLTHIIVDISGLFDPTIIIHLAPKLKSITFKNMNIHQWTGIYRPTLISIGMERVQNLEGNSIKQLLQNNPQLKCLRVINRPYGTLKMNQIFQSLSGNLNRFALLELLASDHKPQREYSVANIKGCKGLTMLSLSLETANDIQVLKTIALECKYVQRLNVFLEDVISIMIKPNETTPSDKIVDVIGSFLQLKSLTLSTYTIKFGSFYNLLQRLPKLTSVHLKERSIRLMVRSCQDIDLFEPKNVLELFTAFPNLKRFTYSTSLTNLSSFDVDFHRRFADIVRHRGSSHIFKLTELRPQNKNDSMIFTKEKFVKNGKLQHWIGCKIDYSRSRTNFLDLNEVCIARIVDYLRDDDVRSLYGTCTLTKKAVAAKISAQDFEVSIQEDFNGAMDLIRRFGEHMAKLKVDMENADDTNIITLWSLIGRVCSKSLVELTMHHGEANKLNSLNLSFPKLEVLKLEEMTSNGPYVVPKIDCPSLILLELDDIELTGNAEHYLLGIHLDSLRILRLIGIDCAVTQVIRKLSDATCQKIEELTFDLCEIPAAELVNVVVRFRNLTTLHLIDDTIQQTDTNYLFERCRKLTKLTLLFEGHNEEWNEMVQCVKKYCKQLKVLQLDRVKLSSEVDLSAKCDFESELRRLVDEFPNTKIIYVHYDSNETSHIKIMNKSSEVVWSELY